MILAKDFFVKVAFLSSPSTFESKNKLKSRAKINCFSFASNSSNSSNKLFNATICLFEVLALYKFIKMYSESLLETSKVKIDPSLAAYCFLTVKVSVPK